MCTPSFIAVLSGPSRRFPTRVRRRTVQGAQAYVTCPPWDRFAGARRPRRATPEEVRVQGIEPAAGLARDRVAPPSDEPARAPVAVR
jgi:hypothetical protein